MKFSDKRKIRSAFIDAMGDQSVENGINNIPLMRNFAHVAMLTPAFYREIDDTIQRRGVSVDEYVDSISSHEVSRVFGIHIPS